MGKKSDNYAKYRLQRDGHGSILCKTVRMYCRFKPKAEGITVSDIKKVVLAYSGGLDTSIIIPWLKENYDNPEIIAVSGDVGQNDELEGLEEKALKTGASKLYIEDLTDVMVDEVIIPSMMMGAKYEDSLLGTAFARPVIARRLVEIAKAEGADAICHGCTGKGNDQVRFELAIKRFAPEMQIIAPWRCRLYTSDAADGR